MAKVKGTWNEGGLKLYYYVLRIVFYVGKLD